jgi:glycosyltransferase involved in cell wall biosynthesis
MAKFSTQQVSLQVIEDFLISLKAKWDAKNPGGGGWFSVNAKALFNGTIFIVDSLDEAIKFVENLFLTDLKQLTLVIVGGSHEAFNSTESVNSENIIYLDFVKLGELKWLYENAIALINPSIYEGFGIPNLEAIACKTLVFCSNIPVFKEIYKDSVCYFELNDNQSLKALILEQQLQPASFEIFKQKGILMLNAFQNRNRATEILNVMSK